MNLLFWDLLSRIDFQSRMWQHLLVSFIVAAIVVGAESRDRRFRSAYILPYILPQAPVSYYVGTAFSRFLKLPQITGAADMACRLLLMQTIRPCRMSRLSRHRYHLGAVCAWGSLERIRGGPQHPRGDMLGDHRAGGRSRARLAVALQVEKAGAKRCRAAALLYARAYIPPCCVLLVTMSVIAFFSPLRRFWAFVWAFASRHGSFATWCSTSSQWPSR